jgi:hypothetical protein
MHQNAEVISYQIIRLKIIGEQRGGSPNSGNFGECIH